MLFNPYPNKTWFLRVCSTNLLKTLWEKEKLLVTSNFVFFHSLSNLKLSSANFFSLEESKMCRLGKQDILIKNYHVQCFQKPSFPVLEVPQVSKA